MSFTKDSTTSAANASSSFPPHPPASGPPGKSSTNGSRGSRSISIGSIEADTWHHPRHYDPHRPQHPGNPVGRLPIRNLGFLLAAQNGAGHSPQVLSPATVGASESAAGAIFNPGFAASIGPNQDLWSWQEKHLYERESS